ncbi:MAG TPA: hypothetical protein VLR52_02370 [Bacteroidales bacterium]|nr:hypothetical protein [Bacteroidales bacterium]
MRKSNLMFRIMLVSSIILMFGKISFAQDEGSSKNTNTNKEFFRGGIKVEKINDDSTVVYISNNPWHGKSKGKHHWPWNRAKYNGHWAGVELGWNGFVNKDFNMDFPSNEKYLDLKWARSMVVNLNPIELNLNLIKNHFGLTSGLGLTFNNYYFTNSTFLVGDSSSIVGYNVVDNDGKDADLRVNKLMVAWLTLPVMFEYQTNSGMRMNSFHIGVGVVGGVRICSYTKQSYYARNTTYYLEGIGKSFEVGKKPLRNHDEYHLNPFKLDATARIGWSFLNFWGTYSLTTMFQKNEGPELYPYTVGITLAGW